MDLDSKPEPCDARSVAAVSLLAHDTDSWIDRLEGN